MTQEIVLGIGIIVFLLFVLYDKLNDKEHFFLRLLIIFFNITFLLFIPLTIIAEDITMIFYKTYLGFIYVFWTYVLVYIIVLVLKKLGLIVPKV